MTTFYNQEKAALLQALVAILNDAEGVLDKIEALAPGFKPGFGDVKTVRWLTRLLGIEKTEKILAGVKHIRRSLS